MSLSITDAQSVAAPAPAVDPRLPEVHAAGFRALLDIGERALGRAQVDALVEALGATTEQLRDPTAWFSRRLAEGLLHQLVVRTGNANLPAEAGRALFTPEYLGPIYPVYRTFGSTLRAYTSVSSSVRRTDKTASWTVESAQRGHVHLTFRVIPEATPECTPYLCQIRVAMLEAAPTLFGLAPARVEHALCLARDDECCDYQIRWHEPPRRRMSWSMLVLGMPLGASLALLLGLRSPSGVGLPAALGALGAWALARAWEQRRELADSRRELEEHRVALTLSEQDAEARYGQVLEAKAEVESRVDVRTGELRHATLRLEAALQEVQRVDREKTAFFNNVSHELRTPLTLILAPLDALLSGQTPPGGTRDALAAMQRNARRLLQLIHQLLDLAKLDAGAVRLSRRNTDLGELLRAIAGGFEPTVRTRRVRLHMEIDPRLAPIALDASWIESAITNLLANALRAVPAAGNIALRVKDEGCRVVVQVQDDGPGMSEHAAAHVFERFAQGSDARETGGGTGLGLAIVREAARLHGGEVSLATAPGAGAKFTLHLPRVEPSTIEESQTGIQPADDDDQRVGVRERAAAFARDQLSAGREVATRADALESEPTHGASADAPLALVVEDNDDLRRYIVDVLAPRYRVSAARDGARGLELARQQRPDVVIADIAMPELDGFALCRALRAHEPTQSTPCLLLTARSDLPSVVQGFEAGASDYLIKPFAAAELLARVDVHVRARRLLQQLVRSERLVAVGSIAAQVAHHVRNPMCALKAGLPTLHTRLGTSLDHESSEMMTLMVECADRIESVILDLLDLSRVDGAAHTELRPGIGLLASTRLLSARLPPDVQLQLHVDDTAVVHGRAAELSHVFLNLFDNALRAVGQTGTLRVTGMCAGNSYWVLVEDSGPGVEPAAAPYIFEPFYTTRPAREGTGLGLAIAKSIVEEHGGRIDVGASDLGGARFQIALPLA